MIGTTVRWETKSGEKLSGKITGTASKGKSWRIESKGKRYYVEKDKVKQGVVKKPKKKKTIAILLSGRLTSYDKHYQGIMDNLVQGNDVDFYAGISTEPINERLLDGFLKMYKPVAWAISDKPLFDIDFKKEKEKMPKGSSPPQSTVYQARNRDKSRSLLMKSKVNYDWIISTRTDLYYKNKLNYDELDSEFVNIPLGAEHGGIQDKIAIAKKPLILRYLNMYDYLEEHIKKKNLAPERTLNTYLKKFKIPVKRITLGHQIYPKVKQSDKLKVADTGQK